MNDCRSSETSNKRTLNSTQNKSFMSICSTDSDDTAGDLEFDNKISRTKKRGLRRYLLNQDTTLLGEFFSCHCLLSLDGRYFKGFELLNIKCHPSILKVNFE